MKDKIDWYIFVFFARIRTKKKIKELKQNIQDLSWHLGVEKSDNPEILKAYNEAKLWLMVKQFTLRGLQYN